MIRKLKLKIKSFVESIIFDAYKKQKSQIDQVIIANQFLLMKKILHPKEMPPFSDIGFKVHSQFEEDGILLYIFSIIGTSNKRVVEICAGDGIECMAANLIINHGWEGLLFDGDDKLVKNGINYYASHNSTKLCPPIFKCEWLTSENINLLLENNGFVGQIDLLSLDVDGIDYYIMNSINVIKPRVIICETHNVIPSDLAITIPYKSDFNRLEGPNPEFMSVSLLAMRKLLDEKGYRLIGSHRYGFNAIFMLKDVGIEYFPEISVESVHNNRYTNLRTKKSWSQIKDLPWVNV